MIDRLTAAANRLDPGELERVIILAEDLAAGEDATAPEGTPPLAEAPAPSQPTLEPASIDNTQPVDNTVASSSGQPEPPASDEPVTVPPAETPATEPEPPAGASAPEPAAAPGDDTAPAGSASADVVDQAVDLLERAIGVLRDATGKEDVDA